MKKLIALIVTVVLLGASCYLAICGCRNYRLFRDSLGSSDYEVHLERKGVFSVVANPPGRSLFRPGGVLEIYLKGVKANSNGDVPDLLQTGSGTLRVTDRSGKLLLNEDLKSLSVGGSSLGVFLGFPPMLDEFDASKGGPYQIQFEISQPFTSLTGISQTLSVRHFVDGGEQIIHITQFGGSALLFATCSLIVFKVLLPRCSKPIDGVSADFGA